ncbi:MAG: cAMP phosphodiesterase [Cyanobacteriota bacterium]
MALPPVRRLLPRPRLVSLLTLPLLGGLPAQAAPATVQEMELYGRISAVNVCISRSAGVEFEKAAGIAGETITQLIMGLHDGAIQQAGPKPLTIEQVRRGSANTAVIGAAEICPKAVPADVLKKVEAALKQQGGARKN